MSSATTDLRVGQSVARGEFTLDETQAHRKLQEFRLVNPRHFVLELVKAAHLLGASHLEFRIDTDEVELAFNGEHLTVEELESLYSAPFSRRDTPRLRALRHLAIGVSAAQGLGLREFTVSSSGDAPGSVRVIGDTIEKLDLDFKNPPWSNRIYLRQRAHLGQVGRFFNAIFDDLEEIALLKDHCRFASSAIFVNRKRISSGPTLPSDTLAPVSFRSAHETGTLGLCTSERMHTAHVLQHGVLVSTTRWPARFWGAVSVVESTRLTMNLTQSAFVEDDAWEAIKELIDEATLEAVTRHLESIEDFGHTRHIPFYGKLLRVLQSLRTVSFGRKELQPFFDAVEQIPFAALSKEKPELTGHRLTLHHLIPFEKAQLREVLENISLVMKRVKKVRQNVRAWQSRPWLADIDQEAYPVQKSNTLRSRLVAQAALGSEEAESEVLFIKDGFLLKRCPIDTPVGGISLRVSGPILANQFFNGPSSDLLVNEAIRESVKVFRELVDETFSERSERWQLLFLTEMLSGSLQRALDRALAWPSWPAVLIAVLPTAYDLKAKSLLLRMNTLGPLATQELLDDVTGTKWSLTELLWHIRDHGLGCVAATNHGVEAFERQWLEKYAVLRAGNPLLPLIPTLLELDVVSEEEFVHAVEERRQKSSDPESADPSSLIFSLSDLEGASRPPSDLNWLFDDEGEDEAEDEVLASVLVSEELEGSVEALKNLDAPEEACEFEELLTPYQEESAPPAPPVHEESELEAWLREPISYYFSWYITDHAPPTALKLSTDSAVNVAWLEETTLHLRENSAVVRYAAERPDDETARLFSSLAVVAATRPTQQVKADFICRLARSIR